MSLLEQFFSESHLQAIAAMLFHAVWQGTLLAAIAAIVLSITKRSSPALRYNVLVLLLFIFAAGAVYTYLSHLEPSSTESSPGQSIPEHTINNEFHTPALSETTIINLSSLLRTHASFIVLCWMLLLTIRLCYIVTGYYSANRLTSTKLITPPEYWNERWVRLTEQMNISQHVSLMQSSLAKVPMVIGHFKPVVLVPVGMLLSLNPAEAEAVLLHELAHVKRRDYLLNLMQQAIQCIFFFHPAVLWVCSLISAEREHCCDEMAASQNGDKRTYINALVSFYEQTLPRPVALGFGGRNQRSIVDRVKRLIHQRNKTLNYMEKIFLTAALVLTGFFVYAFYHNGTNTDPGIIRMANTDTIPRGKVTMNWTEKGKSYNVVLQNDQISELSVDGKKIPAERYKEYQPLIDRMREDQENAERDAEQASEDAEEALLDAKEAHEGAMKDSERAKRDMERDMHDNNRGNDNDHNNDNDNDHEVNDERVDEIVANAINEVEKVLDELRVELKDGKLRDEVRNAIEDAQQGLKEARNELRDRQKEKGRRDESSLDIDDDRKIEKITEEAVHLALEAAHLGLREANHELKELGEHDRTEQMNRKEYRERKKQLREEYRNSQR